MHSRTLCWRRTIASHWPTRICAPFPVDWPTSLPRRPSSSILATITFRTSSFFLSLKTCTRWYWTAIVISMWTPFPICPIWRSCGEYIVNIYYLPAYPSSCRINNCDICNITDWIHRIERKCPQLEQLSCMGNPGIQTVFKNHGTAPPAAYAREYILEVLPNLKYLDGVPRQTYAEQQDSRENRAAASSSCNSVTGTQGHESSVSTSDKPFSIGRKVASPTLSFKEFFRLKPAKKTPINYLNGNGSSTNWSPACCKRFHWRQVSQIVASGCCVVAAAALLFLV